MIDAAIEAGVKRIVVSEFSSNLEAKGKEINLDIVKDKLEIRRYVEEAVKNTNTEWSSINNGPFLDLGVKVVSTFFLSDGCMEIRSANFRFRDSWDQVSGRRWRRSMMEEINFFAQPQQKISEKLLRWCCRNQLRRGINLFMSTRHLSRSGG